MTKFRMNRRHALKGMLATAAAMAVGGGQALTSNKARAAGPGPRFLIVLPAFGGAQIINSVLPIAESESSQASVIDCYPDDQLVNIGNLRTVDARQQSIVGQQTAEYVVPLSGFVNKHYRDMMVTTQTGTSVNHAIAQHRALTGGGAWSGRTLQECVALTYGKDFPLPNVNMSAMGYLQPGDDNSISGRMRAEPIVQPLVKPLAFSASQGLTRGMENVPAQSLINEARAIRNDRIDPESAFYQTFRQSERLKLWMRQRSVDAPAIEGSDLINKLFFAPEIPDVLPLSDFGLSPSEDALRLAEVFPDLFGDNPDPLERQAALAFLLIKNQASVAVTLSPTFETILGGPFGVKTPPLAFDGSHQDHRAAQSLMWFRVLSIADRLIDLLSSTVYDADTGETFWDRTMIHFATDFGRSKRRPANQPIWGTGHHINNGVLTISPMVRGNTVLGGVDPNTALTHGFDLQSGAPAPTRNTSESEVFAGLLQAMGVDTSEAGLPDVAAMRG
jgi:hypothetical protein